MKLAPALFIKEVIEHLETEVEDRIEKENVCRDCFGGLRTVSYVDDRMDGFPIYGGKTICDGCQKEVD